MPKTAGLPLAEAIRFGWQTVRDYPVFVVGTALVAIGVPGLIKSGGDWALDEGAPQFAVGVISTAVSATLTLGLAKLYLLFRDGRKPLFENLFDGLAQFHIYIGASIVVFFAVLMGLILFLIPGIVILIRLWFLAFVIVDRKTGPLDAIQRSWDISRGHAMDLLLLFIILVGLNLLGAICLVVGLLVTVPMSGLALAHIYRTLVPATTAGASSATEMGGNLPREGA